MSFAESAADPSQSERGPRSAAAHFGQHWRQEEGAVLIAPLGRGHALRGALKAAA